MGAALTRHGDIDLAIAIEVPGSDLESDPNMPLLHRRPQKITALRTVLIEDQKGHILPTWIATIVSEIAFSTDQFLATIPVQIGQG
jgi:hypothetical protein